MKNWNAPPQLYKMYYSYEQKKSCMKGEHLGMKDRHGNGKEREKAKFL